MYVGLTEHGDERADRHTHAREHKHTYIHFANVGPKEKLFVFRNPGEAQASFLSSAII
jgi:hypothetical protein